MEEFNNGFKKIQSLQGLRAIAFISIVFTHSQLSQYLNASGAFGVSVFICLSGFLLGAKYISNNSSIKSPFSFTIKKVSSLFVLNIIMTVISAAFAFATYDRENFVLKTVLQTFALQIWQPNPAYYYSYNGPSWYLAVCVVSYLLFPLILWVMKKYKSRKPAVVSISVSFLVILLIALIAKKFGNDDSNKILSSHYLTYYFPLSRIPEFIIGCNLGYIFVTEKKPSKTSINIISVISILLLLFAFIVYDHNILIIGRNYFKYTALFVIPSCGLIYSIANEGYLSELISKNLLVYIGDLSPYGFLIHVPIIRIVDYFIKGTFPFIPFLFELILTLLLSYFYKRCYIKIKNSKIQRT